MKQPFTNDLIHETSPYLLQHAHNPVQWHPWGEPALKKARDLDKPILVSIGYAACHWCHVMERESFENVETAAYMNEHFVNIKIDREERPDLDHIYMDAVQAIAGNGGWPLNVFLTTDAKPFYGGTYFPPVKAFNRPSWKEVLFYINDAWEKRRTEIEQQADTLLEHISAAAHFLTKKAADNTLEITVAYAADQCALIAANMLKSADTLYGGFGTAPKFPQTFSIQYLLQYGHLFNNEQTKGHALFSLQKMLNGGIYDHLAGGLSRYSTDAHWLAPHFEKMLYDNALLVNVLSDAFQITGDVMYEEAINKTLGFVINEMHHPDGGYYAALDADSEGVEGKFYVWDKQEIEQVLGKEADIFCKWYGVSEKGNWEEKNILNVSSEKQSFAREHAISISELETRIKNAEKILLDHRNVRIRPATDDKIILGWNALLLTAFCKASAALGNDEYKACAIQLFSFIKDKFSKDGNIVFHTYKDNIARHPAYLDDYAYLIQACISLQSLVPGSEYIEYAQKLASYVIDHFQDKETGFFYYTHEHQKDVITRKIEIYDNAIPSGNSIMAENLFLLSIIFDDRDWWTNANKMLNNMSEMIFKYPNSLGIWAGLILDQSVGINEILITGQDTDELRRDVLKLFILPKVLLSAEKEGIVSLFKGKNFTTDPLIYLCKNYACYPPVETISELKKLLEKG